MIEISLPDCNAIEHHTTTCQNFRLVLIGEPLKILTFGDPIHGICP